ncbi:MAG: hypothetical protein H6Q65_2516, partial [Firmicutes bacterium]|nr:hypothetical protein [Bacillota bacterium]
MRALQKYAPQIQPLPILRKGPGFHDTTLQGCFASASALRVAMQTYGSMNDQVKLAVPVFAQKLYQNLLQSGRGPVDLSCLENIILAKLRTINPELLTNLPDISEGLEHRFLASSQKSGNIEELLQLIKSKRYPKTRLQRILIQLLLGITKKQTDNF